MKPLHRSNGSKRLCRTVPFVLSLTIFIALIFFTGTAARAGGTVTSCTESSLRAAMAGGGTVTFACDGVISLTGTITNALDTVLNGNGHQITIGNSYHRIFFVNTNVTFTVINLTIANGYSDNGAGIFNAGGRLVLRHCLFLSNTASGFAGTYNSGNPGTNSSGGAVFNAGAAAISDCTFLTNAAIGGAGGVGYYGNTTGGAGGAGGAGCGGAIYNSGGLTLSNCTFAGNTVAGGSGGAGATGGSGGLAGGTGGAGGAGGSGSGGAFFNAGIASAVNTTVVGNSSAGGAGGTGGNGGGYGGMYGGNGGNGNTGGSGFGGAICDASGHCSVTNSTLAGNFAIAGAGGAGGLGSYATYGSGSPGLPGSPGSASGGGISASLGSDLVNVLLVSNTPANGSFGITDGGHNLSSDNSCGFTSGTSLSNTNPLLGPLMDNGGSTMTMALLPGSPAIDAGDNLAAPPADQRGVSRPAGLVCDIGAYECGPPEIIIPPQSQGMLFGSTADFSVTAAGYPPLKLQWFFNRTNMIPGAANSLLELTNVQVPQSGGYSVVVTNSFGSVTSSPAQLDVFSQIVRSSSEAALRAALALTNKVIFECDGTIALTNTISINNSAALDGTGHRVTISGNNAVGVFYVAANVNFLLTNLTIANGSNSSGAGIFNNGGIVSAANCNFISNRSQGSAGADLSGTFGQSGGMGQSGYGGAVYNSGVFAANNCAFISNAAVGGAGGAGGQGYDSPGAPGGAGADGVGGAICNFGTATVTGCLLASNSACGGAGGLGGWGGMMAVAYGNPGGQGGVGGGGNAGALFNNGSVVLVNNTFAFNLGAGGQGGGGGSGGMPFSPDYHWGYGGTGGGGGAGYSAIYDLNGHCGLTNCTLALNRATNGIGGAGGGGWGGIAWPGTNGIAGAGGLTSFDAKLLNTILSGNAPSNCSGTITDVGHNISSDTSIAFTASGSLTNTDPMLGPLANNGGPTLTMALLPGSPAIDAGSAVGAPAADQRGVARPQGPGVDIGAFEFQYIPFFTGVAIRNATNCQLQMAGLLPNQSFTVQASSNLVSWFTVTNLVFGTNGVFQFVDPVPANCRTRFYRFTTP